MYNVPPKFNQICRLCLTFIDTDNVGGDAKKLSIFNKNSSPHQHSPQHHQQQQQHKKKKSSPNDKSNNDNHNDINDGNDQLNKKVKRSNEISISLCGGSGNNGFIEEATDDDSEWDITKRILQCLSIKEHVETCLFKPPHVAFAQNNNKVYN
ncbi:unnamed protein product [Diamesa serratosioi]